MVMNFWIPEEVEYLLTAGASIDFSERARSWNSQTVEDKDKGEGEGKVHPRTVYKGPEGEQGYSSTLSLSSALDGSGLSMRCPGHTIPGKETQYPLYRWLGGPQGWSGWV